MRPDDIKCIDNFNNEELLDHLIFCFKHVSFVDMNEESHDTVAHVYNEILRRMSK